MAVTAPVFSFFQISQAAFQIFNDDGTTVNNATGKAALNAAASVAVAASARIRVGLQQSSGTVTNFRYLLEYNVNGGSWTAVDTATSVQFALSPNFADADATTQRLSVPGTFVAGEGIETTRNSAAIILNTTGGVQNTEIEWVVNFATVVAGDVVRFRVITMVVGWTGGGYTGVTLDSYPVYPTVNVGAATVVGERATVFEGVQVGVEATPGVAVPATKRLMGMMFEGDPKFRKKVIRPMGFKYATSVATGKEHTEYKISGDQLFHDLLYAYTTLVSVATITTPGTNGTFRLSLGTPSAGNFVLTYGGQTTANIVYNPTAGAVLSALQALSSVLTNVTVIGPTGGPFTITFTGPLNRSASMLTGSGAGLTAGTFAITTTAATNTRRWTFLSVATQPDALNALTLEKGSFAGAGQTAFTFVDQFQQQFTETGCPLSGHAFGQQLIEPFTITPNVTTLPVVPIDPAGVGVLIGDSYLTMALLARCKEVEWSVGNRQKPGFFLDPTKASYSAAFEAGSDPNFKLTVEHDSNGVLLLNKLRANTTQVCRIECTGPQIETGYDYRLAITGALKIIDDPRADKDDVYCSMPDCEIVYDATLGYAYKIEVDLPQGAL